MINVLIIIFSKLLGQSWYGQGGVNQYVGLGGGGGRNYARRTVGLTGGAAATVVNTDYLPQVHLLRYFKYFPKYHYTCIINII